MENGNIHLFKILSLLLIFTFSIISPFMLYLYFPYYHDYLLWVPILGITIIIILNLFNDDIFDQEYAKIALLFLGVGLLFSIGIGKFLHDANTLEFNSDLKYGDYKFMLRSSHGEILDVHHFKLILDYSENIGMMNFSIMGYVLEELNYIVIDVPFEYNITKIRLTNRSNELSNNENYKIEYRDWGGFGNSIKITKFNDTGRYGSIGFSISFKPVDTVSPNGKFELEIGSRYLSTSDGKTILFDLGPYSCSYPCWGGLVDSIPNKEQKTLTVSLPNDYYENVPENPRRTIRQKFSMNMVDTELINNINILRSSYIAIMASAFVLMVENFIRMLLYLSNISKSGNLKNRRKTNSKAR